MKTFTLTKYNFGDYLGIVGDTGHSVLCEMRKRIDVDEDMPRLIEACGLKPDDVTIDVGGFICDTAIPLLQHGCYVTVFEPFLDAYVAGLYNTRHYQNRCRNLNAPVGNGEWVKFVYECPGPNFGMRRVVVVDEGTEGAVKTVRLDNCGIHGAVDVEDRVKLIKLDAEGSEPPVLDGAKALIESDRPAIYIEIFDTGLAQRGYTRDDIYSRLTAMNYKWEMWGSEPRFDILCMPKT